MFQPRISIVIPVYNGENYMAQAIDSALAQDYPDFEVIVVNDGSTDGGATDRIARGYGSKIRYISQENGGVGAALNTAIGAMTGSYFSWHSHDDLYLPNKLSHQVAILNSLPDKETILYSNYRLIDGNSKPIHEMRIEQLGTAEQLNTPLYPLTRGLIHGCTLLIPRVFFERYGLFDPALKTTQDYDLWFRMLRHVPIHFDARHLVCSRMHPGQGSRTLPQTKTEGDRLWTRFIDEISADEATRMYGSHYRYLQSTGEFLQNSPYKDVVPHAFAKAREALARTLVTAVIPFRDRIDWTIEAIESVRAQTHSNLEIILVDDGSTEDTARIREIASADQRVRYHRQEGRGAAAARNRGIELANGPYIAFLDSDDSWHPEKIETQLAVMEKEGLAFSHTNYIRCDDVSGSTSTIETAYFKGRIYPRIIHFCPIATPTVMVRTDVIRRSPFPEGIAVGEDIITWIPIAADHEVGTIPAALTTVRISATTTSISTDKLQRGLLNILSFVLGHPRHGVHHAQIIELMDVLRRLEMAKLAAQPPEATQTAPAQSSLKYKIAHARELLQAGLRSLRYSGFRPTLQRTLVYLRSRNR
jgi:glycosyltransferase involved in cell wall biosynthesis